MPCALAPKAFAAVQMGPSTMRRRTPFRSLAALAAAFVAVHKGLSFVPVLRTSSHSGLLKVSQAEQRRSVALRARGGDDDDDDDDDYEFPGAQVVLELLTPGQELDGVVTQIRDFGAFVDIGADKEGLVPISFMSSERVESPEDVVKVGQGVKVWVVRTEVADGKVLKYSLSMVKDKALRRPGGGGGGGAPGASMDLSAFEGIDSDTWLSGKVVSLESYGAFVAVKAAEGGSEAQGLVHVSQIRDGFVESVDKELSIDQEVQVRILDIDKDAKKISLTMKSKDAAAVGGPRQGGGGRQEVDLSTFELVPNTEWLTGKVASVQDFGAFVSVAAELGGQEAQGLVHISELQDGFVDDVYSVVSEGQEVKVRVKGVENGKLSLTMRSADGRSRSSTPSKEVLEEFENIASTEWLPGVVKSFQDFGAFVEVTSPAGSVLDGLLHISQISDEERVEDPQEWLEMDQEVKVRVVKVDGGKISLSMKELQTEKQKQPEDA